MQDYGSPSSRQTGDTCNALLLELQQTWVDIGETEAEKDRMLMELEEECMNVYRRKVGEAASTKSRLRQSIAAKEAELATLMAALGELDLHSQVQSGKKLKSLKEQLSAVEPLVDDLRSRRDERVKKFSDIKAQIEKISAEMSEYCQVDNSILTLPSMDEQDLSVRRLSEYENHLRSLQKEKSRRLHKVLEYVTEIHSLCGVLGLDFGETVSEVHPSLQKSDSEQSTNISDKTLQGLEETITKLYNERDSRCQKLKDVMSSLSELWNLMDTPETERSNFSRIAQICRCSSDQEIREQGAFSMDVIGLVTTEVERLTKLKAGRMKELVMKRRSALEEICRCTHVEPDSSTDVEKLSAMIDSGLVDPSELLSRIECQMVKANEEALSRKEIIDRIDRWLATCEEEKWLEEYNMDENRYSSVRGAHINLKRAERARVSVSKIPALVDSLISKTLAWEEQMGMAFLYDGLKLVSILEDYKLTRQQKEEEKKRFRDQKKLNDLLLTEKECLYGSKPSPRKGSNSFRKLNGYRVNGNGTMTPGTPRSHAGYQNQNGYLKGSSNRRMTTAPLNFVALTKDDAMSYASVSGSEPDSPCLKL